MYAQYILLLTSLFGFITARCVTTTTSSCSVPSGKPTCTGPIPPRHTSPCVRDLHVIISRATTECMGPGTSEIIGETVAAVFRSADVDYNPYPANAGDAIKSPYSYVLSETAGVRLLTQMIKDYQTACGDVPIALIGYSQGAQVVADVLYGNSEDMNPAFPFPRSDPLPAKYAANIAAVALFGDPSFMPGQPWNWGTTRGKSSWFPRSNLTAAAPYADMTRSYCDANDTFCDCGAKSLQQKYTQCVKPPGNLETHKGYIYCDVYTQDAIDFILSKTYHRRTIVDQFVIEPISSDSMLETI